MLRLINDTSDPVSMRARIGWPPILTVRCGRRVYSIRWAGVRPLLPRPWRHFPSVTLTGHSVFTASEAKDFWWTTAIVSCMSALFTAPATFAGVVDRGRHGACSPFPDVGEARSPLKFFSGGFSWRVFMLTLLL